MSELVRCRLDGLAWLLMRLPQALIVGSYYCWHSGKWSELSYFLRRVAATGLFLLRHGRYPTLAEHAEYQRATTGDRE